MNYVLCRPAHPSLVVAKARSPGRTKPISSHLTSPLIENNSEITKWFGRDNFWYRERRQRVGSWDAHGGQEGI